MGWDNKPPKYKCYGKYVATILTHSHTKFLGDNIVGANYLPTHNMEQFRSMLHVTLVILIENLSLSLI
jgi:hypothetical protein